jgi:predicted RND superfamily exporter protein
VDAPLNFANIIALPLMIGRSNAYGVYLVLRRQSTESLAQLLGTNTPRAVLLSGMTTIASFGTLGLATHPGMAGMGFLITLSLGYALLSSLVILPAIMATIER